MTVPTNNTANALHSQASVKADRELSARTPMAAEHKEKRHSMRRSRIWHAEQRSPIGEVVVIRVLMNGRKEQ
jgi:hypothetical protein